MIKILEAKYGMDLVSRDVSAGLMCAQKDTKTNCGTGSGSDDMLEQVRQFCEGTEGKRNRNCAFPIGQSKNSLDLKVEFKDPCPMQKKQFKIRAICIKQPAPTALPPTNKPITVVDPGTPPTPLPIPHGTVTPVPFWTCEHTRGGRHMESKLASGKGVQGLTCEPGYSVNITSVNVGYVSTNKEAGMCSGKFVDRQSKELSTLLGNLDKMNTKQNCTLDSTSTTYDLSLTNSKDIQNIMPECVNANSCLSSDTDIVFRRIRHVWKLKQGHSLYDKFDQRTSACIFKNPKYTIYPLFHGSYMCYKN